jgi:hypothetical protein
VTTRVESVVRHANQLLDLLVDVGPLTGAEACEKLGWSRGRFDAALRHAREHLCAEMGMAIPNPTPGDGWRYQVTTEWEPVEVGASYSLGLVESRLHGIHRDVRIVLPHLTRGSKEWRRANFLNKHLSHILATLTEIDHG